MSQAEQSLKNHARTDPMFHGFLFAGALFLLMFSIYALFNQPDTAGFVRLFGVVWLIVLMFNVRLYALKVQDRVIRLEERLRLAQLLPETARGRLKDLSEGQLIALRFAWVFLLMAASFRSMDPALEESAIMSGASLLTVFRRITVPLARPALYAAILIMVVRTPDGTVQWY